MRRLDSALLISEGGELFALHRRIRSDNGAMQHTSYDVCPYAIFPPKMERALEGSFEAVAGPGVVVDLPYIAACFAKSLTTPAAPFRHKFCCGWGCRNAITKPGR